MTDLVERPLNLVWQSNRRDGKGHVEWCAPCGCAYHPEPEPHVHSCHRHTGNRATEIERLQAENEKLESKLHDIRTWCRAYPETVFIEPTKEQWAEADRVLNEAGGCSLTAISGSNMRHVVKGIGELAELKDKNDG